MSSQKGNIKRTRGQKYQNIRAFKNNLYDQTPKTKFLNSLEITDVCSHCKGILEWRIRFKKYKLLKGPKKCVKCEKKNVILSYRTICAACAAALKVCPKCCKNENDTLGLSVPVGVSEHEIVSSEDEHSDDEN